jgi:hypothetical protein
LDWRSLSLGDSREANPEARAVGFDIAWNHVALSVPNIAESIAWYERMLGFEGTVRGGQPGARQQGADLRRGNITIELFQVPAQPHCRSPGRTRQKTSGLTA